MVCQELESEVPGLLFWLESCPGAAKAFLWAGLPARQRGQEKARPCCMRQVELGALTLSSVSWGTVGLNSLLKCEAEVVVGPAPLGGGEDCRRV